jgi:hypothetical protein
MPAKGTKFVATLFLSIATVKVGDEWRWLFLQLSA